MNHATEEKAQRLIATGAIQRAPKSHVYIVKGDHDTYIVAVVCDAVTGNPYTGTCNCTAGRNQEPGAADVKCSHLRAAIDQATEGGI